MSISYLGANSVTRLRFSGMTYAEKNSIMRVGFGVSVNINIWFMTI